MGPKLKFIIATAFLLCPLAAHAQTVEGSAVALTGDTIDLTGTVIKLRGVDAPAADQSCSRKGKDWPCGGEAKALLTQLVSGSKVQCEALMRNDELTGVCRTGNIDLAEAMVGSGLALANGNDGIDYSAEQERAQSLDLGIWGSEFEQPSAWRAAHPRAAIAQRVSAQASKPVQVAPRVYRNEFGCAIKGNHSRYGDWIYHLPGTRYYNQTRPEELFCTEEDAIAAGYRRSKAG